MATHRYTPKIGTVIHSPVFGGGATITVVGIVPKRVPIVSRERGHDALVSVRITCDGDGWYGEPGEHYGPDDPDGKDGPYAYNGGLCECH